MRGDVCASRNRRNYAHSAVAGDPPLRSARSSERPRARAEPRRDAAVEAELVVARLSREQTDL